MNLRRIWLEPEPASQTIAVGESFELPSSAFHHVAHVTRLSVGDVFEGINGSDVALELQLIEVDKKSAVVKVIETRKLPTPGEPRIHLAFAVSKWEVTESVIEKSVELGVSAFQPLLTANSFVKKPNDISEARVDRWQRIVRSATVQSARGSLMELLPPKNLAEFLQTVHQDGQAACLFAYEGVCPQDIRSTLADLLKSKPSRLWALVGSEGGFSDSEVERIRSFQLTPATMGPQILRAETACLAILSVIKYETGNMR